MRVRGGGQAWDSFCAAWLVIQVEDFNWVQKWRLQAEVAMRQRGQTAMTDDQVRSHPSGIALGTYVQGRVAL